MSSAFIPQGDCRKRGTRNYISLSHGIIKQQQRHRKQDLDHHWRVTGFMAKPAPITDKKITHTSCFSILWIYWTTYAEKLCPACIRQSFPCSVSPVHVPLMNISLFSCHQRLLLSSLARALSQGTALHTEAPRSLTDLQPGVLPIIIPRDCKHIHSGGLLGFFFWGIYSINITLLSSHFCLHFCVWKQIPWK